MVRLFSKCNRRGLVARLLKNTIFLCSVFTRVKCQQPSNHVGKSLITRQVPYESGRMSLARHSDSRCAVASNKLILRGIYLSRFRIQIHAFMQEMRQVLARHFQLFPCTLPTALRFLRHSLSHYSWSRADLQSIAHWYNSICIIQLSW